MTVVSDAVDRSERLVASLLALATSDHGVVTLREVDLRALVETSVARVQPGAARRGIEIATDPQPPRPNCVNADPELLERLVDNLVDNAVRHNVDGGRVGISLRSAPAGVELAVVNTGPIVSPADVDALFEPFHRATRGAGDDRGFGLGLAIVRSVVTAHEGGIEAAANPDGGLTVRVTLPVPESRAEPTAPPDSR
jgi:signal transduction histidine kinase